MMFEPPKHGALPIVALATLLLLEARAEENPGPTTLTADFTMTRTLKVLRDSITSTGRMTLGGPGRIRWETLSPARSVLVIKGRDARLEYPDMGVSRKFNLGEDPVMKLLGEHLMALTVMDFDSISKLYRISELEGGIKKLVPLEPAVQSVFGELRVRVDPNGVASMVEIVSKNGDVTVLSFKNVRQGPPLSDTLFEGP